jgi:hypothetical protein
MDEIISDFFASPVVGAAGTALAGIVVALWLAAAWWAYRDAGRRTESTLAGYLASFWIVVATPLFLPFALVIYRVARPQVSAAEQRASALARELSATHAADPSCPACAASVDAAWLRCPDCATWLAAPCTACGRWSDPTFDLCPWCGAEPQRGSPEPQRAPDPQRAPEPQWAPVPAAAAAAAAPAGFPAHGMAAADALSAAAMLSGRQRRAISSARPLSYAASRDISSAS